MTSSATKSVNSVGSATYLRWQGIFFFNNYFLTINLKFSPIGRVGKGTEKKKSKKYVRLYTLVPLRAFDILYGPRMKKFRDPCAYTIEIQRFQFKTCHTDRARQIVIKLRLALCRADFRAAVCFAVLPVQPSRSANGAAPV